MTELAIDNPRAAQLIELANSADIRTHEMCSVATELRKQMNYTRLELEKVRKELKKPYLEAGREVDERFKAVTVPLAEAITQLDRKLAVYAVAVEQQRADARSAEIQAEQVAVKEAEGTDLPPDLSHVHVAAPTPAPIRTRAYDEMEIYDEALIPREYLVVNEAKVRAALKDGIDVPGARINHKQRLA